MIYNKDGYKYINRVCKNILDPIEITGETILTRKPIVVKSGDGTEESLYNLRGEDIAFLIEASCELYLTFLECKFSTLASNYWPNPFTLFNLLNKDIDIKKFWKLDYNRMNNMYLGAWYQSISTLFAFMRFEFKPTNPSITETEFAGHGFINCFNTDITNGLEKYFVKDGDTVILKKKPSRSIIGVFDSDGSAAIPYGQKDIVEDCCYHFFYNQSFTRHDIGGLNEILSKFHSLQPFYDKYGRTSYTGAYIDMPYLLLKESVVLQLENLDNINIVGGFNPVSMGNNYSNNKKFYFNDGTSFAGFAIKKDGIEKVGKYLSNKVVFDKTDYSFVDSSASFDDKIDEAVIHIGSQSSVTALVCVRICDSSDRHFESHTIKFVNFEMDMRPYITYDEICNIIKLNVFDFNSIVLSIVKSKYPAVNNLNNYTMTYWPLMFYADVDTVYKPR